MSGTCGTAMECGSMRAGRSCSPALAHARCCSDSLDMCHPCFRHFGGSASRVTYFQKCARQTGALPPSELQQCT
jgi:hypothetical protein